MLKRFEVENYKGFNKPIIWDLSQTKDYSKSKNLVKKHISKNSIVYGKNASGKSSFCCAIMDITTHLLDVEKDNTPSFMRTYIGNNSKISRFRYDFLLGKKKVVYEYQKTNEREMILERLFVDDKEIVHHDFENEDENFIKIAGAERLRTKGLPKLLSVIKFIYNNTIQSDESIISQLIVFVSKMLYFRSLREANQYLGYKLGGEKFDDIILKNNKLTEFNQFLTKMGLDYNLVRLPLQSGQCVIGAKFENDKVITLHDIASSGTKTLMLFYCWSLEFQNLSFLIIDEFDAYYHHDVAKKILEIINGYDNLQSVVTTHNVTLLNTEYSRPDCAYIIDETGVRNLSSRTDKELRKNHNIEKLYREGVFSK